MNQISPKSLSKLDREKCSKNQDITSILDPGESVILSSLVYKFNHHNK